MRSFLRRVESFTSNQNLFAFQAKVLKELAERESSVVMGRAADYVLKDFHNLIRVYIHAPKDLSASSGR